MRTYKYRLVRHTLRGEPDTIRPREAERQGWVPVPEAEVPEELRLNTMLDDGSLRLYRMPIELAMTRREFFARHNDSALENGFNAVRTRLPGGFVEVESSSMFVVPDVTPEQLRLLEETGGFVELGPSITPRKVEPQGQT